MPPVSGCTNGPKVPPIIRTYLERHMPDVANREEMIRSIVGRDPTPGFLTVVTCMKELKRLHEAKQAGAELVTRSRDSTNDSAPARNSGGAPPGGRCMTRSTRFARPPPMIKGDANAVRNLLGVCAIAREPLSIEEIKLLGLGNLELVGFVAEISGEPVQARLRRHS